MATKRLRSKKRTLTLEDFAAAIQKDLVSLRTDMVAGFQSLQKEMATKHDLEELRDEVRQCATHGDLADLRQELLEEIAKIKYAKEIDELRARVVRVEEKLGLKESRHAA